MLLFSHCRPTCVAVVHICVAMWACADVPGARHRVGTGVRLPSGAFMLDLWGWSCHPVHQHRLATTRTRAAAPRTTVWLS